MQLVSVPLVGVPKIGVTKVGLVDKTVLPVPVDVVTPVPPLATGKVPETCVVKLMLPVSPEVGSPVQLVSVPLVGVPKIGAVIVGLVRVNPATVAAVAPNATEVLPIVTLELVSAELAMLDKVPLRVRLPEEVTVPDSEIPLTVPVPATEVTVPKVGDIQLVTPVPSV